MELWVKLLTGLRNNNMAKMKPMAPKSVAKKDNTRVARTRVSSELVGDKPDYRYINIMNSEKPTKKDSTEYASGFRYQVGQDKKTGGESKNSWGRIFSTPSFQNGTNEAAYRRSVGGLNEKAMVRDSSIPLAPTQFND
jgi:hypothetical protein